MELLLHVKKKLKQMILKFTFQYGATSTIQLMQITYSLLDLHSNMELLLPHQIDKDSLPLQIYIPIWSYFYKFQCCTKLLYWQIYIPIWSYFYLNISAIISLTLPFTFQYGATSTSCTNASFNLSGIFTFQYGATSTFSSWVQ